MANLKLLPGERLIHKTNPHLLFLIWPIAGLLFLWLILWFGSCPLLAILALESPCHLFAFLVISFSILVIYLDWHFNRFYLTNYRIIKEMGIVGKRFMSVQFDKIQDISVGFGFWGRIFGFGDFIIESAGTFGQMNFKGFPKPLKIKGLIEGEIWKISFD